MNMKPLCLEGLLSSQLLQWLFLLLQRESKRRHKASDLYGVQFTGFGDWYPIPANTQTWSVVQYLYCEQPDHFVLCVCNNEDTSITILDSCYNEQLLLDSNVKTRFFYQQLDQLFHHQSHLKRTTAAGNTLLCNHIECERQPGGVSCGARVFAMAVCAVLYDQSPADITNIRFAENSVLYQYIFNCTRAERIQYPPLQQHQ